MIKFLSKPPFPSPYTIDDLVKSHQNYEALAKVFFCGSTSSPQTEKLNNFNLSPFTLSLSMGKLRTFARSSYGFVKSSRCKARKT